MFSNKTPKDQASREKTAVATTSSASTSVRMPSVLSSDVVLTGSIRSDGELIIEGKVLGDVVAARLIISETGAVEGTVRAESADIRGRVIGNIDAENVSLFESAFVEGDITHSRLQIAAGAHLQGAVKQKTPLLAAPVAEVIELDASRVQA